MEGFVLHVDLMIFGSLSSGSCWRCVPTKELSTVWMLYFNSVGYNLSREALNFFSWEDIFYGSSTTYILKNWKFLACSFMTMGSCWQRMQRKRNPPNTCVKEQQPEGNIYRMCYKYVVFILDRLQIRKSTGQRFVLSRLEHHKIWIVSLFLLLADWKSRLKIQSKK